jgi:hypothetical protein
LIEGDHGRLELVNWREIDHGNWHSPMTVRGGNAVASRQEKLPDPEIATSVCEECLNEDCSCATTLD